MSVLKQAKTRIVGLVVRSVRNFFFEHPMATYAAALAYRGLFGLFPFVLILVVLVGALGFPDFFDRATEHARAQSSRYVPNQPFLAPFIGGFAVVVGLALIVFAFRLRERGR